MAGQVQDNLQGQYDQLAYIEQQIEAHRLDPAFEERIQQHRHLGSQLQNEKLSQLPGCPSAPEEQAAWHQRKAEFEAEVEQQLALIRQQEGLEVAWATWCEREKLRSVQDSLHKQQQQQQQQQQQHMGPGMAHAGPAYAAMAEHAQHSQGTLTAMMHPAQHPESGLKMEPNGGAPAQEVPHQGWEQHQHQAHLHIAPLAQQQWDAGQQQQHQFHQLAPQQQPHIVHHHPQAMMGGPQTTQLPLKLCRRCSVQKPVSEFYRSKANSDGYDGRCKTCDAVQCAERRKRKQRVEAPTVEWKVCRRCQVNKPFSDFYRNKTNPDGLYNNCKACFAADASARRDRMAPLEERTVPNKICKRCKKTKTAGEFYKNKLMSDGLYSHCKDCYSQAATERASGRTPAEQKECRRCKEVKMASDFYNSKMTADGLQSYCKACYAVAASQRRSKLQEQQGLDQQNIPQDVQAGMDEAQLYNTSQQQQLGMGQLMGQNGGPMEGQQHIGPPHAVQAQMGHPQMPQAQVPVQHQAQLGVGPPVAQPQLGPLHMMQSHLGGQQMGAPQQMPQQMVPGQIGQPGGQMPQHQMPQQLAPAPLPGMDAPGPLGPLQVGPPHLAMQLPMGMPAPASMVPAMIHQHSYQHPQHMMQAQMQPMPQQLMHQMPHAQQLTHQGQQIVHQGQPAHMGHQQHSSVQQHQMVHPHQEAQGQHQQAFADAAAQQAVIAHQVQQVQLYQQQAEAEQHAAAQHQMAMGHEGQPLHDQQDVAHAQQMALAHQAPVQEGQHQELGQGQLKQPSALMHQEHQMQQQQPELGQGQLQRQSALMHQEHQMQQQQQQQHQMAYPQHGALGHPDQPAQHQEAIAQSHTQEVPADYLTQSHAQQVPADYSNGQLQLSHAEQQHQALMASTHMHSPALAVPQQAGSTA